MPRPSFLRPSRRRPSLRGRPSFQRPNTKSASSITVQSVSAAFASGAGLPTADTLTLTFIVDNSASAFSAAGVDISSKMSGYCGNRVLDFTNVTITGGSSSFAIVNIAVSNTIVGNGTLTTGTPTAYSTSDNKVTYTGGSSSLPGLNAFSNKAIATLTGDTVPVVCKLEWGTPTTSSWNATMTFSKNIDSGVGVADQTYFALTSTGCALTDGFGDYSYGPASNQVTLVFNNSVFPYNGNSSGDKLPYDAGDAGFVDSNSSAVPAFTFPLYTVGGALAVPVSAAYTVVPDNHVNITMSTTLTGGNASTASGMSGRYSNLTLGAAGTYDHEGGASVIYWTITPSGANVGVSYCSYDGSNADTLIDSSERPVPPWTNLALS